MFKVVYAGVLLMMALIAAWGQGIADVELPASGDVCEVPTDVAAPCVAINLLDTTPYDNIRVFNAEVDGVCRTGKTCEYPLTSSECTIIGITVQEGECPLRIELWQSDAHCADFDDDDDVDLADYAVFTNVFTGVR